MTCRPARTRVLVAEQTERVQHVGDVRRGEDGVSGGFVLVLLFTVDYTKLATLVIGDNVFPAVENFTLKSACVWRV